VKQDVTPKSVPGNPGDQPQPMASTPTPPAPEGARSKDYDGVSWVAPKGWSEGPARDMRLATLTDGKVEIAISAFGGDVGGTLLNVNRWCQQVGLPPFATQAEAEKVMKPVDVNGKKVRLVDLTGPTARMRVAIVPGEGRLVFFKMMGSGEEIAARQDVFDKLVQSIRVE
jgi:hypothetical protein